jgi:hypothetical protein
MPYTITKQGNRGFKVCKKTGKKKCFSKKPLTKKKALAQMAAIRLNENYFSRIIEECLYE